MKPSLNNQHKVITEHWGGMKYGLNAHLCRLGHRCGSFIKGGKHDFLTFFLLIHSKSCALLPSFYFQPPKVPKLSNENHPKKHSWFKKKKNILCKLLITKPTTTGINKSSTVSEYASINHSSSCTGTKITEAQGKHPQ